MIESILIDVLSATASLVFQACSGIYLCKIKLLDQEKLNYLSKLVEQFFTPCLIFSSFVKTLDMTKVEEWLIPMILSCLSIIQGMLIGYTLNKYLIKDKSYEALIVLGSGLAMTTNMQLNLSSSLSDYLDQISVQMGYQSQYTGQQRAVKYVMIFTFINTIMRWTLAKEILVKLKKKNDEFVLQEQQSTIKSKLIQLEDISFEEKSNKNKNNHNISNNDINNENDENNPIITSILPSPVKLQHNHHNKQEQSALRNILSNPPIQVSILSVIVCLIPQLRELLIQDGSFLNRAIYQPSASIGHVILPLVLMTLGGNLYISRQHSIDSANNLTYQKEKISRSTIFYITLIRLFIMPFIGYINLYLFSFFENIQDPALSFIVIISNSVPSAINLLIISTLYFPKTAKEMAKVLLCGYTTNILTLPIVMTIFFNSYLQS